MATVIAVLDVEFSDTITLAQICRVPPVVLHVTSGSDSLLLSVTDAKSLGRALTNWAKGQVEPGEEGDS